MEDEDDENMAEDGMLQLEEHLLLEGMVEESVQRMNSRKVWERIGTHLDKINDLTDIVAIHTTKAELLSTAADIKTRVAIIEKMATLLPD